MAMEKARPERSRLPGFRPSHVLVHYDEITLKGRNRGQFERRLHDNVRRALRDEGRVHVHRAHGRIIVELRPGACPDLCARRLERVFGVTRFVPVIRTECTFEAMEATLAPLLGPDLPPRTFAVASRRANKNLPFQSIDVNRRLGAFVAERTGWTVRIREPDLTIHVHLVARHAYLGLERLAGQGGLPTGTTGRVVSLLSGGIDSPVATHQLLRRGAEATLVHFHSQPHTSPASVDKVRELAGRLLPPGGRAELWMVPFAPTQQKIVLECPEALRVVLYRRFMLRVAEAVAGRVGALALVTGDSLGQVASQTLENLDTIQRATRIPVLRPLIGLHKAHIVDEARRIGTYETSIEPHDDCCSFLMPRHPATRSRPEDAEAAEAALDVQGEVESMLDGAESERVEGLDPR